MNLVPRPTTIRTLPEIELELKAITEERDYLNAILESVIESQAVEEPTDGLILPEGMERTHVNPVVKVTITINGKGVSTATTFSPAAIEEAGWPAALAQACMQPMGLMALKLHK